MPELAMATRFAVPQSDYERTVCAHAEYYSVLAEREGKRLRGASIPDGGRAQLRALLTWRTEAENIYAALDTALLQGPVDRLLRIGRSLPKYLNMTGGVLTALEKCMLLLEAARNLGDSELHLTGLLEVCQANWRLGRYAEAHEQARLAGDIAISLGERSGEAFAINHQGTIKYLQGNHSEAGELFMRALKIRREIGDRYGEATTLNTLGNIESNRGDSTAARETYSQALSIRREIGDRFGQVAAFNNLGLVEFFKGDLKAAHELHAQSLAIAREIGDRFGEAIALNNMGLVDSSQGRPDAARESCSLALIIRREIGDRSGQASSLKNLGNIESTLGNYRAACQLQAAALLIVEAIGDKRGMTSSCGYAGMALAGLHCFRAAATCIAGAMQLVQAMGQALSQEYQGQVSAATALLDAAVASKEIQADDLARWRAEGKAMSLDELAEFTLAALAEAQGDAVG